MMETKDHKIPDSTTDLEKEFAWFSQVLEGRFKSYFESGADQLTDLSSAPDLSSSHSRYANFIKENNLGLTERLVLCLAISPHIKPQLLDLFFTKNPQLNQPFTEFGGYPGKDHRGFLPTGETVAFLLANQGPQKRRATWELFSAPHPFATQDILYLERRDEKEPFLSGRLIVNSEFLDEIMNGENYLPAGDDPFPATRLTTKMEWEDLIVSPLVMEEILQIKTWIKHQERLMEDPVFRKHIKPGYRSLFYGPPGTGKRTTASLLGKACGLEVYRVDLSLVVSKFIGETEKNLAKVFKRAKEQSWILFFDEADALFGKRTQNNSSNDRYANQEVAYLLQQIEDFPGVIIMASNLKSNIDEAFSRRFQSIVYFPIPDASQRLLLWKNIFSGEIKPEDSVDLEKLAEDYELSGGAIIHVLQNSTLLTIQKNKCSISMQDIIESIRKEYQKYGRTI